MLEFIRRFIRSKIGAAVAIAVLLLIALSFAGGDITGTGVFGGVAGGDRVANVGDERIDSATLRDAAARALESAKASDPSVTFKDMMDSGGFEQILDSLIDLTSVSVFGHQNGIIVSPRLVDSEIAKEPALQGADDKFSQALYRQWLKQRGMSESTFRNELEQRLIARQVLVPASFGSVMPSKMTQRYAASLSEIRDGEIVELPSLAFAPTGTPTDKQLATYYSSHKSDFTRPERRVIRFASFGPEIAGESAKATEAEIAARYKANAAEYRASETREISQLIVATEADAKAAAEAISKGQSLDSVAKAKGLAVAKIAPSDRAALTSQSSEAVANSAFAAQAGKIANPARSPLGWHVMRIDAVKSVPARTLEDVRAEISAVISREKQDSALEELIAGLQEELESGANLADVAKELGIEVATTPPLTADGKVFGKAGASAPEVLASAVSAAFQMEVEKPQLAVAGQSGQFVMYDVTDIAPSAPAPLKDVRDQVIAAYKLDQGYAEARKAAVKIQSDVRKGTSFAKAVAATGKQIYPPRPLKASRLQIMQLQQQGREIPEPITLMFEMAQGTIKVQSGPDKQVWYIIRLKQVEPGKVRDDAPGMAELKRDLGGWAGEEYAQALQRAIRNEVGVQKNEPGIRAVREQLGGGS